MKRAFAGAIASLVYWGVGLTVWSAYSLADLLGHCLDNATWRRDKPLWLSIDLAMLAGVPAGRVSHAGNPFESEGDLRTYRSALRADRSSSALHGQCC